MLFPVVTFIKCVVTEVVFSGGIVMMLVQIFSWFWQWKNFENRLNLTKLLVKGFNKNCAIFGPPGMLRAL